MEVGNRDRWIAVDWYIVNLFVMCWSSAYLHIAWYKKMSIQIKCIWVFLACVLFLLYFFGCFETRYCRRNTSTGRKSVIRRIRRWIVDVFYPTQWWMIDPKLTEEVWHGPLHWTICSVMSRTRWFVEGNYTNIAIVQMCEKISYRWLLIIF